MGHHHEEEEGQARVNTQTVPAIRTTRALTAAERVAIKDKQNLAIMAAKQLVLVTMEAMDPL